MWLNPEIPAGLVTFTREILNGKLHFICSKPYERIETPGTYLLRRD